MRDRSGKIKLLVMAAIAIHILATVVFSTFVYNNYNNEMKTIQSGYLKNISLYLEENMDNYIDFLYAYRGLYSINKIQSEAEFNRFVDSYNLFERYTAMETVGKLSGGDLVNYYANTNSELSKESVLDYLATEEAKLFMDNVSIRSKRTIIDGRILYFVFLPLDLYSNDSPVNSSILNRTTNSPQELIFFVFDPSKFISVYLTGDSGVKFSNDNYSVTIVEKKFGDIELDQLLFSTDDNEKNQNYQETELSIGRISWGIRIHGYSGEYILQNRYRIVLFGFTFISSIFGVIYWVTIYKLSTRRQINMKVIIAYANGGSGHKSSANSLGISIKNILGEEADVELWDLGVMVDKFPLNYTDESWELVSSDKKAEILINSVYHLAGSKFTVKLAELGIGKRLKGDLIEEFKEFSPDLVISTHHFASLLLSYLKKDIAFKSVAVAADLIGYPRWLVSKDLDLFACPTPEAAERALKFGLKLKNVIYPHFPLEPKFTELADKSVLMKQLKLDPNKPILLITGGGVGTSSMTEQISEIVGQGKMQILVMCGKDTRIAKKLNDEFGKSSDFMALGFVENMQDYYNLADLVIAKPGPATIVELEALGKKAIFTRNIGPQEEGNISYLEQNPNFVHIGGDTDNLLRLIDEKISADVVDFKPRFKTDAGLNLANTILTKLGFKKDN